MRRREASGTEQRLSLKTLTELIKASAGSVTKADYWWSVERINALTNVFGAVAWPITVLIVAFVFRRPLIAFLSQVNEFEFAGAKIKKNLQENLRSRLEAAAEGLAPTMYYHRM